MNELSRTTDIALGAAPAQPGGRAPTTTPPVTFRKSRRVVMGASAFRVCAAERGCRPEGRVVPAAGGVLIKDGGGAVIGAVGISGDVSDKDEACALAGIAAARLVGDPGT